MKYLKRFNENKISILDPNWVKLLPDSLTIITNNGEFTLERDEDLDNNIEYPSQMYNLMTSVSIPYGQNTMEKEDGDPLADGEPDTLQFDVHIVKDNKGDKSNPDTLRFNIDITYGDMMECSFTINKLEDGSTKVDCHHYNGKDSLYDKETYWGFSDESLQKLIDFFNRFGFNTTVEDFHFIDSNPDSYDYENEMVAKGEDLKNMSKSDEQEVLDLKGGDKIIRFDKFKK